MNTKKASTKKKKVREIPPLHRRVATLMVDIQDEVRWLASEFEQSKEIENKKLIQLLIMETQQCLGNFVSMIES